MQIDFSGKTVVVTGAAGGLGTAISKSFAKEGANVALCDLRGAAELEYEIIASGGTAKSYSVDITDREAVQKLMKTVSVQFGKIDVLVNNAGINVGPEERKNIDQFSDKWWDAITAVDMDGVYNCSKAAIPYMSAEESSIVNISSIVGMVPLRNQCAFAAAKAGVINLTKAMSLELAERNIRVNAVAPGTIGIKITNKLWQDDGVMKELLAHIPMARQGNPDDVSSAVMFLASSLAGYITGTVLPVDGGWTCGGYARNF